MYQGENNGEKYEKRSLRRSSINKTGTDPFKDLIEVDLFIYTFQYTQVIIKTKNKTNKTGLRPVSRLF